MYDHERVIHHQSKILVLSFSVLFLEKEIRKKKEKGEKEKKEKRKKKEEGIHENGRCVSCIVYRSC